MNEDFINPDNTLRHSDLNNPETFLKHIDELIEQANNPNECKGLFLVKTGNKWIDEAKKRPIPKMLFGEFWYEGELCILFADTNLGKSILAVQIGDSISRGEPIWIFGMGAEAQTVLYFDFELTDKQFESRYSKDFENHYSWSPNFLRVEINPNTDIPDNQSYEEYLNQSFERTIQETGAKILIIDNLTYLRNETEKAKDALPLMKQLKELKSKYGLSMLALAHTPKRDLIKPITRNDLQGSKMLINFCDSSFAIGECNHDPHIKYLKQIKQRNTEQLYGAENVIVCQIVRPFNFLLFEFIRYASEREFLKHLTDEERETQKLKVIDLNAQGLSLREIGKKLGISHMSVQRILNANKAL